MLKKILLSTALSVAVAGSAFAQSPTTSDKAPAVKSDSMKSESSGKTNFVSSQKPDQWLASKFKGTDVVGSDNEKIGDVSDILFDKSGKIDAYPEYTGVSQSVVFKQDALPKSPEETQQIVKDEYEKRGQSVSDPTPFQDTDAIATTKEFAEKNNLNSVADLKGIPTFTLGARPEFKNRFNGLKGMAQVYGVKDNVKFKQLALGLQYPSLDKGDVDTANVFSTDAQLASGKYKVLEDPKGVFGFQNVYFVINKDKLDALGGQQFMDVINSVNKLLTDQAMPAMNAAVDLDKKKPADVAKAFLQANNLVN